MQLTPVDRTSRKSGGQGLHAVERKFCWEPGCIHADLIETWVAPHQEVSQRRQQARPRWRGSLQVAGQAPQQPPEIRPVQACPARPARAHRSLNSNHGCGCLGGFVALLR